MPVVSWSTHKASDQICIFAIKLLYREMNECSSFEIALPIHITPMREKEIDFFAFQPMVFLVEFPGSILDLIF